MFLFVCMSLTLTGSQEAWSWKSDCSCRTGCQWQKVNRKWQQCHFLLSPCKSWEDQGKCQLYIAAAAEKKMLFIQCLFAAAAGGPTNQLIFPVLWSLATPCGKNFLPKYGFLDKIDMYVHCTHTYKTVAYKSSGQNSICHTQNLPSGGIQHPYQNSDVVTLNILHNWSCQAVHILADTIWSPSPPAPGPICQHGILNKFREQGWMASQKSCICWVPGSIFIVHETSPNIQVTQIYLGKIPMFHPV